MKPFLLFATNLRNNRGVSNRHVEILKTDFGAAPKYYRCFAVFPASKNTNLDYFRVYPPVSKWRFVSYLKSETYDKKHTVNSMSILIVELE